MAPCSSPRRIIFLNRFFYPDHAPTGELLSDLAFELSTQGYRVTVITSRLLYDGPTATLLPRERINGVEIWRVWTSKRGRQRLIGRSLDYATFYIAAAWRMWRLARSGDILVTMTDPPLLSIVAAPIAWLRRAHLVNWLQDVFPEVAEALNVGGSPGRVALTLLRPFRNWSLRAAKANVVVGEGMATRLREQGIASGRIKVIPNWCDGTRILPIPAAQNKLRKGWALNSRFIVGYAGNLGRAHDTATILDAMTLLQQQAVGSRADAVAQKITFVFVGGGAQRARLERQVLQQRLPNVRLFPYQPRDLLAETLGVADLHLVSLNPALEGLIVPSKFYGIAAAGRPIIFIGAADGEIARLIEEIVCGFTVAPGNGQVLLDRILQLASDPELCESMGARARTAFAERWDRKRAVAEWAALLSTLGERHLG
jgi:glycosyltransferase involved in cell wall biosynthesis